MTLVDLFVLLGVIPYVCLAAFTYTLLTDVLVPLWPEWFTRLCAIAWPATYAVAIVTLIPWRIARAEARFLKRQLALERLRRENAELKRIPVARVR